MICSLTNDTISNVDYKQLFLHSPLPMFTCDEFGYLDSFNAAAENLWARGAAIHKDKWGGAWQLFSHNGSPLPVDEYPMSSAFKRRKAIQGMELVIQRPDLSCKNVLEYAQPMFDKEGNITGGFSTIIDITESKTAREKQAILSAIVESSDDAIVSKDLNGIITSWNRGAQKIFGYSEEEVIGRHISLLIPEELMDEESYIISNIKAGRKTDHFQTERITKYGKRVNISLTVSPVKNDNGEITGASKIARDITELLQKQKELEQNAQRLEILNALGIRISAKLEKTSIIELITNATTEITGAAFGAFFVSSAPDNEMVSDPVFLSGASKELFSSVEVRRNTQMLKEIFDHKHAVRIENISKDEIADKWFSIGDQQASLQVLSYMAVPVMNASGTVFGGLFFGHPLPGVFGAEHEELVKSIASQACVALENSSLFGQVKMLSEKKDEFIALASHELKTPLTTVNGYLQVLESRATDSTTQLFIERSLIQIKKLNSLVSDLFDVSKVEAGKLHLNYESFDLYCLLQDVAETYQHSCTTHRVVLEFSGTECALEGDRQRIEQVIINLIANAIKYSPNTDEVLVRLTQSNDEATVMVKDNGIGLSKEQQEKIFTRFYRADGNSTISGLGLGLYLSNEIIKRHQGEIYVNSEPAKGAEFYFSIPIKRQAEIQNGNQ